MQDASSLRGDTVIQTLVNMSSEECRDDTATKTIGNIVGHDVPNDLNRAILDIVGAPDDILGDTVVETIANMVHAYDNSAEVPDNVIDALVMLNEVSGGEPYSDGRNLFAISTASDGYIGANGGYNAAVNENHPLTSAFIPVKPGQSLVFQAWSLVTSNGTSSGNGNIWLAYCFYDSSKAAVGDRSDKYGGTILESGRAYSTYSITVPNGAAFIRVTYRRVLGGFAKLEYGEDATDWTPAPQDVEVVINEAYDCFANDAALIPPLRMTVFGKSVQNGTPVPNAPVRIQSTSGNLYGWAGVPTRTSNGVTWTSNPDGYVHASGTATAISYGVVKDGTTLGTCNRPLLPAGTYTANSPDGVYFDVEGMPVGGENVQIRAFSKEPAVFTLTEPTYVFIGVRVPEGAVVDDDYHVVLYEGITTDAFVPYNNVGLWIHGSNWLNQDIAKGGSKSGITVTEPDENGWFSIAGTSTATSSGIINLYGHTNELAYPPGRYTLRIETDGTPLVPNKIRLQAFGTRESGSSTYMGEAGLYTLDYSENGINRISIMVGSNSSGTVVDGRFRVTLVSGVSSYVTYAPYAGDIIPIDMDGHVLRSLPDGTRDFITVGQDGMVTLTQQVGELTVDGTEKWSASSTEGIVYSVLSGVRLGSYLNDALCDRFVGSFKILAGMADPSFKIGKSSSGTSELLYFKSTSLATSAADFKAWLANNPTTIIYPLAEPITHDLGYIDVPSLPSPDFSVSVVAGIQPTMTMRYIRN